MVTFLKPLTDTLSELAEIVVQPAQLTCDFFVCKVLTIAKTCNLPAKALILNAVQYNGKCGFHKCEQPGETVRTEERGHVHACPYQLIYHFVHYCATLEWLIILHTVHHVDMLVTFKVRWSSFHWCWGIIHDQCAFIVHCFKSNKKYNLLPSSIVAGFQFHLDVQILQHIACQESFYSPPS